MKCHTRPGLWAAVAALFAAAAPATAQDARDDTPSIPRPRPQATVTSPQSVLVPNTVSALPFFPAAPGGSVVIIVVGGAPQAVPFATAQAVGADGGSALTAMLRARLAAMPDGPDADLKAIRQDLARVRDILAKLAATQDQFDARLRRLEVDSEASKKPGPKP